MRRSRSAIPGARSTGAAGRSPPRERSAIHLVYYTDSLASGGAQRQLVQLACSLHGRDGVRVSVLVYHDIPFFAPPLREAGVPIHVLPKRGKLAPAFLWALRRWLIDGAPDVIHAFQLFPALWAALVHRTLPRSRRPVFVAAERSALLRTPINEIAQRLVYRRADAVTANSVRVADEIVRRLGVPAGRVHYLPNGIDLAAWDARAVRPAPISPEPGCLHLALVGGLRREKNHALLLDALSRLETSLRSRTRVWLVGGETGGSAYAAFVRDEISRRALGEIVRIVPETAEIPALLRVVDALVLPSLFEGFPNVLLEAMAAGIPALACAVGDVPDLIGDGETGLLVAPGDAAGLTRAIGRLHAMGAGARRAMGSAGRTRVESRYRMEGVAARHLALYTSLVAASPAG